MNKLSKIVAFLPIAASGYWLLTRPLTSSAAQESAVVLFASYRSGAGGASWLTFRADSTYQFIAAGLLSETVTTGRYTRTDSIILLDRLPKAGLLKSKRLLVRYLPTHDAGHTRNLVWQTIASGKADSTLIVFTGYPYQERPIK